MPTRVRAIIIQDNKILLIRRKKDKEIYWVFPGGQVESGEINELALARECLEELGVEVRVKELAHEMLSQNPETYGHNEYFFKTEIIAGSLGSGRGLEWQRFSGYKGNYKIEWFDLSRLLEIDLRPTAMKKIILNKFLI